MKPVTETNFDETISLTDTQYCSNGFKLYAGVFAFLVLSLSAGLVIQEGDWRGMVLLCIPVAIWILAKSTERTTPKIYMTLYPERVECCGGEQDFKWSEVEGIHWPRWQDDKHRIRIRVAPGETHTSHEVQISLRSLSARDQMALVQYLRRLGARLEQKNWPEFCRNRAIPLVERSQQKDISNRNGSPEATTRFNEWLSRHSERHPFLSGFLVLPVVMIVFAFAPVLCPPSIVILTIFYRREISRKIWWMLSTVTCITTVTNTRLVWGQWISPFAEVGLGIAGLLFILGWFAADAPVSGRRTLECTLLYCYTVAAIGFPLALNAIALGWATQLMAPSGVLAVLILLLVPLFIRERKLRHLIPALEADSLHRWEVYEETGELPEAAVR